MSVNLAEAIKQLVQERGIPEELVEKTIEEFLMAAYKKKFGHNENAYVKFNDDRTDVRLYAKREIVDGVYDPILEIELEDAIKLNEECEVGDELLIEINPDEFDRIAVQTAKQRARQTLKEIQKDTQYSDLKEKEGEMVIGYYQRERNGNIYVDLGSIEGILPKRYQSPREIYRQNDRIKALIYEVNKSRGGLQVVLSRTHTDFVKKLFELEVPEIYDNTIDIFKIVREAGYRTKMAVRSLQKDVDPIGACIGMKGIRIQTIVRELEGEKIDVVKYDIDPKAFIRQALTPAEVLNVFILDEAKRQALAVVEEDQLSKAIGKQGLNVRLANRLVDWNIDVKTVSQFEEMDISADAKKAVSALFTDEDDSEEIENISELSEMPERLVDLLKENGIELIESLIALERDDLEKLERLTSSDVDTILSILADSVDIVEEEEDYEYYEDEEEDEEDSFECPECGHQITIDMTSCPNCGVGLSFEVDEDLDEKDQDDEE